MSLAVLNVTTSAVSSFSTWSFSWLVGILAFIAICLILFLLFKFFRKFVVGIIPTFGVIIIIFISKYIGVSAGSGDLSPAKWLCYLAVFIIISTIIGHILLKKSKTIQEMFEEEPIKKSRSRHERF